MSEYNKRRAEGVRVLPALLPALSPVVAKRCLHVVSENARVRQTVSAMQSCNVDQLKSLLSASYFSLRDDYQVSYPELDILVDLGLATTMA